MLLFALYLGTVNPDTECRNKAEVCSRQGNQQDGEGLEPAPPSTPHPVPEPQSKAILPLEKEVIPISNLACLWDEENVWTRIANVLPTEKEACGWKVKQGKCGFMSCKRLVSTTCYTGEPVDCFCGGEVNKSALTDNISILFGAFASISTLILNWFSFWS